MILRIQKHSDKDLYLTLDNKVWAVLSRRAIQTFFRPDDSVVDGLEREISHEEQDACIEFLYQKAETLLLDYLAVAERCEYQARNYLKRFRFHPSLIDRAIDKCRTLKYIDDARFSSICIESLIHKNKSWMQIVAKLMQHHIAREIWEPILEAMYLQEEQSTIIHAEIEKLICKYKDQLSQRKRQKIISSLFRKGFPLDSIISALDAYALPAMESDDHDDVDSYPPREDG